MKIYVFFSGGAVISWKSTKQEMVSTSSNHAEIMALYEATKEAIWLHRIRKFIMSKTGKGDGKNLIFIGEDNAAAVTQIEAGYIKGERNKHIDPKFFYAHEEQDKTMKVIKVTSSENTADIMTKSLSTESHCSFNSLDYVHVLIY